MNYLPTSRGALRVTKGWLGQVDHEVRALWGRPLSSPSAIAASDFDACGLSIIHELGSRDTCNQISSTLIKSYGESTVAVQVELNAFQDA